MTPFEEAVLFDCLDAVHAYRMLHNPEVSGGFDAETMLSVCRRAGFSEDAAQKAASQRAWERLQRELPL